MCDQIEIILSFYKSSVTIMSFQRKKDVDVWSPRQLSAEIKSNEQYLSDFKSRFSLEQVARGDT